MKPQPQKNSVNSPGRPAWWINAKRYDTVVAAFSHSHLPPCYMTTLEGEKDWLMIHQAPKFESANMFETIHGKSSGRAEYNLLQMDRARKLGQPVSSKFYGLSDLFVPVMVGGRCQAMLATGPFLRKPVSSAQLYHQWQDFSGQRPGAYDPDFMRYVGSVCRLAPLEDPAYGAFFEFMALLADLIAGEKPAEPLIARMDQLRLEILPRLQPYRYWEAAEMMTDRVLVAGYMPELTPKVLQELRISRMPTTVLAVMPRESGKGGKSDPVESLVRASRFQKDCFALCAGLPETISGRLSDYGAFFLISCKPGKSPTQERLELRDRAQQLAELTKRKLGLSLLVGVGGSTTDQTRLFESLHQGVVALHLCLQRGQDLIFFHDQVPAKPSELAARLPLLPALSGALIEAFRQVSAPDILLTRDAYLRQVILESAGNLAVMRTHFLDMTYVLLDLVEKKSQGDPASYARLAIRSCAMLQEAQSVSELLDAFQRGQSDLQLVFVSPVIGSRELRLASVSQYVEENLQRPIKLMDAAAHAGLSPFHFSRAFKKHMGLGFQKYLQQQRLKKASRLLKSNPMPAYLVALECGFSNPSHFSKTFQAAFGFTPMQYRKSL